MPTTAEEQYLLELLNEARLDPMANARRYISGFDPLTSSDSRIASALTFYQVNGQALEAALKALTPVAPLAWNDSLGTAAERHSAAMIGADEQSHQVKGEDTLTVRTTAAGYTGYSALGENVFAYAQNLPYAHAAFMVDWGDGPNGMQSPAGHRDNIMSASFTEVGIDISSERNSKTDVGPYVVTQDFGTRGKLFITGVAYGDSDLSNFYTIGEGTSGVSITGGGRSVTSAFSGGYSLEVAPGTVDLTLRGGEISGAITVRTTIVDASLKLDIVNGSTLLTSGSISASGAVGIVKVIGIAGVTVTTDAGVQDLRGNIGNDKLEAGAGEDKLNGGAGNDELYGGADMDNLTGGAGNDLIDGGAGTDIAHFSGARNAYTLAANSDGSITLSSVSDGVDTIRNVEFFMFSDGQYSLKDMGAITNYAPTVAATQAIGTTVGTNKQFVVPASDRDGDQLSFTAGAAAHGSVTHGGNGVFTYAPTRGYVGTDSFNILVSDGKGGTASQTVTVTIGSGNTAPTVAPTQSVSIKQDVSRQINISANDPDGDTLTYSATGAGHGTVVGGNGGVFTYTPTKGYYGGDAFTVTISDGKGGTASQVVNVDVTFVAPPTSGGSSSAPFQLFMPNGFVDKIGGTGAITGTNGFQDITLLRQAGAITFDGSFNRGGDIIRLPGNASEYKIALNGSVATLSNSDSSYALPIGALGTSLVFADGVRKLYFDDTTFVAKIGIQAINGTPTQITAPTDHSPLPSGQLTEDDARLFLSPGASVTIDGDHVLFGTSSAETLRYLGGDLQLDGSFNKGGDTLRLPDAAEDYQAQLFGSTVVIISDDGRITIPVGPVGMTLDFAGDERSLRVDTTTGKVMLGDQEIALTGPDDLDPADGARLSIDRGSLTNTVRIDLTNDDYTLTEDANVDTFVTIAGFNRGDVIEVTGAPASEYNFTTADVDGDGRYDDLSINCRTGTTDNLISLLDVVSGTGAVYNLATAEAAVGYQLMTFG